MSKSLTTSALVNTIMRRALIPTDQSTFTSDDIQDIMNEELGIHVLPMLIRAHEEYSVIDEDVPLTSDTSRYKIPYRAVGNKLREVQYVDSSGSPFEMTRVSLEDRPETQRGYTNNRYMQFYLQDDNVVLLNDQLSSGSLRMSYYVRPNTLVKDNRAGIITNVAKGATQTVFTLAAFPDHFSSTTVFDFIQGKSPNKIKAFDITVDSLDSVALTLTFNNSDLTAVDLAGSTPKELTFLIGDHIMKESETIVPQLPTELHPILAQRTAVKLLEALGDTEGMRNAQQELERMEYNANTLIENRAEGSPQKIRNRHSTLNQTGANWRRR